MGYGMKMFHKYRKESFIATLGYKPKIGDIIEIGGEWYEVDSFAEEKRACYATFANSYDVQRVTGRWSAY